MNNPMRHFESEEFDCKCGCDATGDKMKMVLLSRLDAARDMAGFPFHITSGMRCEAHNAAVGGSRISSHLDGYAVDIAVPGDRERFFMLHHLYLAGFRRIGISASFIHVDVDPAKEAYRSWVY